ncbi:MAG: protein kinase, partial [Polyangiaceae bacterium]
MSKPEDRQDVTMGDLTGTSGELPPLQKLAQRYVLLGLIGVGGMGSVYRARDEELDEIVALKVLRRELVDAPGVLARFRQEVKLARRVTHKNIARTYDIGEHEGEKFITMEFVDGEPLSDLLARTRGLPVARAVDIGAAICTGLGAAHQAGVVHRDLKPDNVLIAKDGRVVITDFGIARGVASAGAAIATQGLPVGTPAYMAPEQVEGGAVDVRADIYAFGEILYELLTGERAWKGDSVYQVAAARLISPPPDPRVVRPDLPTSLATLILRCMARKADDRFPSAAAVMQVLTSLTLPAVAIEVAPQPPPASHLPSRRPTVETTAPAKSLAVLVFRNGGPPEDEYLADGLTEDLIDTLSMSDRVRVRALGAVLQLKGREGDPRKIGRDLDVQVVIEGSVKRVGETLRINARLISVADGFQLWAKRFDRPVADFLKVGDEMADAVANALAVDRHGGSRATVADPVALDLYLRGRHEFHRGWSEATKRSIELFSEALARVPNDPVILSAYAMAQLRMFSYGVDADVGATIARQAAEKARSVAPNLPEPHLALATIALAVGDQEGAARELRRVFELGSGLADAHDLLGRVLVEAGLPDEGLRR